MFSFFSRRPEPPSDETRRQLKSCFDQFKTHVERMFDYYFQVHNPEAPPPSARGYFENAQKKFRGQEVASLHSRVEAEAAIKCLERAQGLWPKGKAVFRELQLGLKDYIRLLENSLEMLRLTSRPLNSRSAARLRQIIGENRRIGANSDSRMQKGLAQLKDWAGLEVKISYYD